MGVVRWDSVAVRKGLFDGGRRARSTRAEQAHPTRILVSSLRLGGVKFIWYLNLISLSTLLACSYQGPPNPACPDPACLNVPSVQCSTVTRISKGTICKPTRLDRVRSALRAKQDPR